MEYTSTRDKSIRISSTEAIVRGISEDGGLFVPLEIPKVEGISRWKDLSYKDLAYELMSLYFTDFEESTLKEMIEKAYDDKFESEEIAPLKKIGEDYFLELFHGPTLAFKDMALSILPLLLKEALKAQDIDKEVLILTATSGDTGKAALEGFADLEGTRIMVFYPIEGVSPIQKLQMTTQEGDNTSVAGIKGDFDDAQRGVKDIFNDRDLKKRLNDKGYILSSANSINIGRLIPQVVYYFYSYLDLLKSDQIKEGEEINISVPTGNFGNILAAFYAKEMGLPINKLLCASNENNILTDFFKTGIYDKRRDLALTTSPSMDILVSSNLERLLYHLNEDEELIKEAMTNLSKEGIYEIQDIDVSDFYANFAREEEVLVEIERVYNRYNYLIDTHTAVASKVNTKYNYEYKDYRKTVIVSTASPYKFPQTVARAIEINLEGKDDFAAIESLAGKTGVEVPVPIRGLKDKKIIHHTVIDKRDMKDLILDFLEIGEADD